jgi:hypothetical protein
VGLIAASLAAAAAVCLLVAGSAGKLWALGLAIGGVGLGLSAFRRSGAAPRGRLLGAAAASVALVVFALAGAKVGLTLAAIEHVAALAPD